MEPQTLSLPATRDEAIYNWPTPVLNHEFYGKSPHREEFGTYGFDFFEEDLNDNPDYHFLSPIKMYEYDSDSDDWDGEEVEWDAGITDFALFDNDRRRAQETGEELSSKWDGMLQQQSSALQRSMTRNRANSFPMPATLRRDERAVEEEMPSLTPDTSPELRDDLDPDSFRTQTISRTDGPHFLTITVTPPSDDEDEQGERKGSTGAPAQEFFPSFLASTKPTRSPNGKLERPGLRHSRTMSGHIHTWRRPGMQTVGENSEGEERAEQAEREDMHEGEDCKGDADEIRGRRR